MFKKILIIFTTIFCVVLSIPTLFPNLSKYFPSWVPPISLGLDLKGGAQLLLEVDTDVMLKEKNLVLYDSVRSLLIDRSKGVIKFSGLHVSDEKILFSIKDINDTSKVKSRIKSEFGNTVEIYENKGSFSLKYSDKYKKELESDALSRSIKIVRSRIDALGTKEPSIQSQSGKYILIQLPGVDNPERIKELIGKTAKLSFHLVAENVSSKSGIKMLEMMGNPEQKIPVYLRVEVSGENLVDSKADFGSNNMPVVTTVFDSIGSKKFAKLTVEHVNDRFAIVLDDKVLSAPVIREPIFGGRGQISGGFTLQEAKDLAVLLRSGALPAPLSVIEERSVGAGLGADTIAAGKIGALFGLIFVIVFMLAYYRTLGLIADIVLVINLLMIIGISAVLGTVLTLPGIAGIVLTLGMAVDANILPFERIKDELKLGIPMNRAIDSGFKNSMKAVMDGNLTNLICSLILFQFGAGPIRGFAVTLSIGVITTLFTCILLSKIIIDWLYKSKK